MTEAEFWDTSFYVFSMRIYAHRKRTEQTYQIGWEQTRWLASILLQPHSKRTLRPRQLIIFPWEQPEEVPQTIPKDFLELAAAMDRNAKEEGLI
jgi:hypothetical protein